MVWDFKKDFSIRGKISQSKTRSLTDTYANLMKTTKIVATALCFAFLSVGAFAQEEVPKELPPIKDLPKTGEAKSNFEFDKVESYKLYDSEGTLIKKGKEKMVDMTELPKGTYFFSYDDTRAVYKKK
ncbi:MAG: hypothetical protein ACJAQ4_002444 [Cryomorphaceae bacterium]|jgi:hypothetical protein